MVSFYHEPLFSRPNPPFCVHVHCYWPWWAENHLHKSVDLCYIVICMGLYTRKACSTLYYFCWHQHISSFVLAFLDCENGICIVHQHITYWNYVAARQFLCPTATREVAVLLRTFTWASTPCAESASLARVSACTCYTQRKVLYRQPTIPWHFQTKIPWHLCMKFDEINRWNFNVFSNI